MGTILVLCGLVLLRVIEKNIQEDLEQKSECCYTNLIKEKYQKANFLLNYQENIDMVQLGIIGKKT